MWVEELVLENIKCFEKISIRLGTQRERHKWITLLGENGGGKSTILQAAGLMLAGPEGAQQLLTRPDGWLRDEKKQGKIRIVIHQDDNDPGKFGTKKERKSFQFTMYVTGNESIRINNKPYSEPALVPDPKSKILSWLRVNALNSKGNGWFAAGYGAFRRLTRRSQIIVPSLQQPLRYTNFISQVNEDQPLSVFEQWLVYLDFRIAKDPKDQLAIRQRKMGVEAINQLLPDGSSFHSVSNDGKVWFRVGGQKVSTISLSDGYRSIMALAGDLVWRLIESFPDSKNPLKENGTVLLDELDIHLHPVWQRNIAGKLRDLFPNMQFVVATHSPLIAAGAGNDAVTYRFVNDGNKTEVVLVKNIASFSVDKILESDAFGLISPFSPETQERIDRYYTLKKKLHRGKEEERELQMVIPFVREALGELPGSDSLEGKIDSYLRAKFDD